MEQEINIYLDNEDEYFEIPISDVSDEESSDPESREIDYPDASEVHWSDDEEREFHHRDSSRPPILRRARIRSHIRRNVRFHPYKKDENIGVVKSDKIVKPKIENKECAICLEEVSTQGANKELYCSSECGNMFHQQCIKTYTKLDKPHVVKCPLCRSWSNFNQVSKYITRKSKSELWIKVFRDKK